jgi:hypothetical protein
MIRPGRRCGLALVLALGFLAVTPGPATAGMDASLEQEYRRLETMQRQIESLPAYRASEELRRQISDLKQQIERLGSRQQPAFLPQSAEHERLSEQIRALQRQLGDAEKAIVNFRDAIGARGEKLFPQVRNRVAAFTYDDPHATGLGDPIAFLLSKKLLFSTRVSSFAIVNYRRGADRDLPGNLTYFDRVDAVTKDQNFPLAIWGRLSGTERGVRIDSYLQVPGDADTRAYLRSVQLPTAMGGGTLTARLKPDRILLQTLDVGPDAIDLFRTAARQVATLRATPDVSAPVTGRLGDGGDDRGPVHSIIGSERDWVRLRLADGSSGWTSVDQFCTGICGALLDVAGFANDVIAIPAGLAAKPVPKSLTREATAMSQQLTALASLDANPAKTIEIAQQSARDGAGFANLLAVARVRAELNRASARGATFDRIKIDAKIIRQIVQPLVEASIADPSDVHAVQNLAVLFGYLGDDKRRGLALDIAASLNAKSR